MLSKGYGIMPNKVLFDKKLRDKEKLLYVLISSLSAEKGYCFATNKYLAEKLNNRNKAKGALTPQTISSYISNLKKAGYIRVEYVYEENQIVLRKIHLNEINQNETIKEKTAVYKNNNITEKQISLIKREINSKYRNLSREKKQLLLDLYIKKLKQNKKPNLNLLYSKIIKNDK